MLHITCILLMCLLSSFSPPINALLNLTLPHQHPHPESVVHDLQRKVNASLWRREMLSKEDQQEGMSSSSCLTGNPIDDCWRCDPNWAAERQELADEALWIVFAADMTINLKHELIFNSYKTLDGRGANVHVTGHGCITLQYVSNIIIHNIHVHHCTPSGNTNIRASPTHVGWRGKSDGDGISIFGSRKIWIDHCSLSYCTDGLIDAIMGSTGITISNSHFAHHDEVMLLGHDDKYLPDRGMQVTIAFNHFGEGLVQRMPRCRLGYIHVVNNDFTQWRMYAIGPVTKRVDTDDREWSGWNWRTEGDIMVNGAFFVPSGAGQSAQYAEATSVQAKSAVQIDQLTMYSGVFGDPRDNGDLYPGFNGGGTVTGATSKGNTEGSSSDDGDFFGMIFRGSSSSQAAPPSPSSSIVFVSTFLSLLIIFILDTTTNHAILLSLL
ncbi:Putative pectate lyase 12 [Glycine soja]|nr:Putative pectate lyase 12 [Glycine soja]